MWYAFANRSNYHYNTREEAESALALILRDNNKTKLDQLFGGTLFVSAIECNNTGDGIRIITTEERMLRDVD